MACGEFPTHLKFLKKFSKRATDGIKSRTSECHDKPGIISQGTSVNISNTVLPRLPHKEATGERIKKPRAVDGWCEESKGLRCMANSLPPRHKGKTANCTLIPILLSPNENVHSCRPDGRLKLTVESLQLSQTWSCTPQIAKIAP